MALFFPLEAGRLSVLLDLQRPFDDTAQALLLPSSSPDAVVSTVVLLLQGGFLRSNCQQMQALYLLGAASSAAPASVFGAVVMQAASCEAASPVVRALALCLLAGGGQAVARLTPQEFLETFDPGCVLAAPTLLEMQLQWADGMGAAGHWPVPLVPDAAAVRAAVLAPWEAAALRELQQWAEASTLGPAAGMEGDGGDFAAAETARRAAELSQALHDWALALQLAWRHAGAANTGLDPAGMGDQCQEQQQQRQRQEEEEEKEEEQQEIEATEVIESAKGRSSSSTPEAAISPAPANGALQGLQGPGERHSPAAAECGEASGDTPNGSSSMPAAASRMSWGGAGSNSRQPKPSAAGSSKQAAAAVPAAALPPSTASTAGGTAPDLARLQQLLARAVHFPLLPADQRALVAGLRGSAVVVVACRADLGQFRGLIENNPIVAAWLLIAINWHSQQAHNQGGGGGPAGDSAAGQLGQPEEQEAAVPREELELLSKSIPHYLAVLCTLPMTNHSLECMTTLLDAAPPPPTVLAIFVANCTRTIGGTQEAARQARLARLLCAFLGHVLDLRLEGVLEALWADVQSFCISWSRLKEAAALYRRLKALEGEAEGAGAGYASPPGGG